MHAARLVLTHALTAQPTRRARRRSQLRRWLIALFG